MDKLVTFRTNPVKFVTNLVILKTNLSVIFRTNRLILKKKVIFTVIF